MLLRFTHEEIENFETSPHYKKLIKHGYSQGCGPVESSSPDGRWMVVHKNPCDVHWGLLIWDLCIYENDRDVTSLHDELFQVASKGQFGDPITTPWSYDSTTIVLKPFGMAPLLYNLESQKIFFLEKEVKCGFITWSPNSLQLLRVAGPIFCLLNEKGELISKISYGLPNAGYFARWWPNGEFFFSIGLSESNCKIQFRCHSKETADVFHVIDLDPMDLFPYDWRKFWRTKVDLSKKPLSWYNVRNNHWDQILFDPDSLTLYLCCSRPSSDPYMKKYDDGESIYWDEEKRWVGIKIEVVSSS